MNTSTVRAEDGHGNFHETCTVEHNGHKFTAGGAAIMGDRAVLYTNDTSHAVTNWNGEVLGRFRTVSRWKMWPPRAMSWTNMRSVQVTLHDGTKWTGRQGTDNGNVVRLRRCKEQK